MTGRFISQSVGRKLLATGVAILGFVFVYEVSMFDSRDAAQQPVNPTAPVAGASLQFTATAYCKGRTTASGTAVRTGIAASDPTLLPVGSVVNVTTDTQKYNGIYTIMDTGPRVQGRILDLYMWSCNEALAFGRKPVQVGVLRLGWNPNASSPSLVERLFRRREAARQPVLPAPPLPPVPTEATAEPAPDPPPAVEPASAPTPVLEEPAAASATIP
jgi:3D (Asp-Asp-Asp) domain-containing protein